MIWREGSACFALLLALTTFPAISARLATRWRRDDFDVALVARLFGDATPYDSGPRLVSSIDDEDEDGGGGTENENAVEEYRRQRDAPDLKDIEQELQRLDRPRPPHLRVARLRSAPADGGGGGEASAKRKSAPHFLHTPPPLQTVDPRCNSESLQRIMLENMGDDVKESKRAIIQAAEALIGGSFNVICARTHFSYITTTRLFCLVVKRNAKCYAFLTDTSADAPPAAEFKRRVH